MFATPQNAMLEIEENDVLYEKGDLLTFWLTWATHQLEPCKTSTNMNRW